MFITIGIIYVSIIICVSGVTIPHFNTNIVI